MANKKITELDASYICCGGHGITDKDGKPVERRERIGVTMLCPCGCKNILFVPFANPEDGKPPYDADTPGRPHWTRTGDSLETLSLTPSIQRHKINGEGCEWHGYITNGEAITC